MSERDTPLPLTYRADLLGAVMPALQAGECCSLVGTSGAGKSNLVRFLQRPDVQQHYWGDAPTWMILVDTNGLVFEDTPDEYAVAELMIHRLIRESERRGLDRAEIDDFDERYRHLAEHHNSLLAMRYLERICGRLCEGHGLRLIFLFDQFEDVWKSGNARLFLHLRHLRDEFKYRLNYLALTRDRLQQIRERTRDDLADVESFWELFTSHTYGLGPYNSADASSMIDRIAARSSIAVNDHVRTLVITASGGHSGLLRALFWALQSDHELQALDPNELLHTPTVAEECAKIWHDLLPEEQRTLCAIALQDAPQQQEVDSLADIRLKQLVVSDPPRIFSPVFNAYALEQTHEMQGLVVNVPLRQVWINGRTIKLSRLEFNLLAFLASNIERVCSREEILNHLYPHESYNTSDDRIDALMRRLRESLGEEASDPHYIFTRRGIGFQLVNGRVQQ